MTAGLEIEASLATPADEPEIRRLVGGIAMPGAVAVRFEREPDYFLGTTIMGDPCDVLVGRDPATGALAGIACRAERRAFVNGEERRIGYVGQIRVAPAYRGSWLPHRAMAFWARISPPGMLYEGVVARENHRAAGVLVGRRAPGRLRALRLAGLTTCAILLRPRRIAVPGDLEAVTAREMGMSAVVAFLREHGLRRQLYPAYRESDFSDGVTLRGMDPEDVQVVLRHGRVVGVLAAWDQAAYKQDVVAGYGPTLRLLRPGYDIVARATGAGPLTRPGGAIPLSFAACTCVADDDPG
jgi:hypothetical protein